MITRLQKFAPLAFAFALSLGTLPAEATYRFNGIDPLPNPETGKIELDVQGFRWPEGAPRPDALTSPDARLGYQMQRLNDRFVLVTTDQSAPVAVFDLSLHALKGGELILGAIGFGDFTLRNLLRKGKTEAPKLSPEKVEKEGKKLFKKIQFKQDWISRTGGIEKGFSSFRLTDIVLPQKHEKQILEAFENMALTLSPLSFGESGLGLNLMDEFEFRYNTETAGYDVVWSPRAGTSAKKPPLPGIVVNFVNPWQNLAFKHNMRQLSKYGEIFTRTMGPLGIFFDLIISRITNGLAERLQRHEEGFMALMEATQRFETDLGLSDEFVNLSLDMLYLGLFESTGDPLQLDGSGKRRRALGRLESSAEKNRKKLEKRLKKLKTPYQVSEVADGRYAIVQEMQPGQDVPGRVLAIYGLGLKTSALKPTLSVLYTPNGAGMKKAARLGAEFTGFLARALIPGFFGFRIKNIAVGLRIPPAIYENVIRGRMIDEQTTEGGLLELLTRAQVGQLELPISSAELQAVQDHLRSTWTNAYKFSFQEEQAHIEQNLAALKRAIADSYAGLRFTPEMLVPITAGIQ